MLETRESGADTDDLTAPVRELLQGAHPDLAADQIEVSVRLRHDELTQHILGGRGRADQYVPAVPRRSTQHGGEAVALLHRPAHVLHHRPREALRDRGQQRGLVAGTEGVIVDAMLGTGARGALRGALVDAVRWANAAAATRVAVDVPTGVDADTMVQHALEALMRSRTCFVIAHRLSTIRKADRILVLESGRIVESGTHRELLERHGTYARLVRHQAVVL